MFSFEWPKKKIKKKKQNHKFLYKSLKFSQNDILYDIN